MRAEGEDPRGVVRLLSLRDRSRNLSKDCVVYLEVEREKSDFWEILRFR